MQRILNLICVLGYRMHRMCSRYLLQKEMKIHNAFEFYISWQQEKKKKKSAVVQISIPSRGKVSVGMSRQKMRLVEPDEGEGG